MDRVCGKSPEWDGSVGGGEGLDYRQIERDVMLRTLSSQTSNDVLYQDAVKNVESSLCTNVLRPELTADQKKLASWSSGGVGGSTSRTGESGASPVRVGGWWERDRVPRKGRDGTKGTFVPGSLSAEHFRRILDLPIPRRQAGDDSNPAWLSRHARGVDIPRRSSATCLVMCIGRCRSLRKAGGHNQSTYRQEASLRGVLEARRP